MMNMTGQQYHVNVVLSQLVQDHFYYRHNNKMNTKGEILYSYIYIYVKNYIQFYNT